MADMLPSPADDVREALASTIQAGRHSGRMFPASNPVDYREADRIMATLDVRLPARGIHMPHADASAEHYASTGDRHRGPENGVGMLSESLKSIVATDGEGHAKCPACGTLNAIPLLANEKYLVIHDGYYKHSWNVSSSAFDGHVK